jgi:hypothetical protein
MKALIKALLRKLRDCRKILSSDQYLLITRKDDETNISQCMPDFDARRYCVFYNKFLEGGEEIDQQLNEILK